jgi:hypothetical protein
MIDRTELDLRLAAHTRRTNSINGHAWKQVSTLPAPAPRAALASLLRRLATRLDPAWDQLAGVSGLLPEQTQA